MSRHSKYVASLTFKHFCDIPTCETSICNEKDYLIQTHNILIDRIIFLTCKVEPWHDLFCTFFQQESMLDHARRDAYFRHIEEFHVFQSTHNHKVNSFFFQLFTNSFLVFRQINFLYKNLMALYGGDACIQFILYTFRSVFLN